MEKMLQKRGIWHVILRKDWCNLLFILTPIYKATQIKKEKKIIKKIWNMTPKKPHQHPVFCFKEFWDQKINLNYYL